jgi:formate hydrogenlyase subunit 3/multisubunit Na+/H+ antiporter MnhD subunit
MVNPIYIVAILLGIGFLLPAIGKAGNKVTGTIFFIALLSVFAISYQWFWHFAVRGGETVQIFSAGIKPPLSINFQIGFIESIFLAAINFAALAGAVYMTKPIFETGMRAMVLFLLFVMGLNGLIMARDIFNIFVFMEIVAISTYSLGALDASLRSLSAGFKYMLAGGLASVFLLLGIIIVYSLTGTLNLDGMAVSAAQVTNIKLLAVGSFLILVSFLIETKQFPANGWALDFYEGVKPGFTGLTAAVGTTAVFFAFYKTLPVFTPELINLTVIVGISTFFFSNLLGMKQTEPRRMLGYSSIAQMGLVTGAAAWSVSIGSDTKFFFIILLPLILNHFFAKMALFWVTGLVKKHHISEWAILRENKVLHRIFAVMVIALIGLPPFPGFWAKWNLVMALSSHSKFFVVWVIIAGSLFEAVYMLKWLGYTMARNYKKDIIEYNSYKMLAIQIVALVFTVVSAYYFFDSNKTDLIFYLPFTLGLAFIYLYGLPEKIKGLISITAMSAYGYFIIPEQTGFIQFFNIMFILGTIILTVAVLNRKKKSSHFFMLLTLMTGSLVALTTASTMLQFFFAWEIMTLSSYLLIRRGKNSREEAYRYVIFSLAGAFLMLIGFAYAYNSHPHKFGFEVLALAGKNSVISFILISAGFLVKSAALGVHLWIAGSYAKAEDDVSAFLSALLSKAGIFGFVLLLLTMGIPAVSGSFDLAYILGWFGALTALIGTMMSIYEEDAKRLLAYSSMGQVGYIILGLAIMSSLGWTAALFQMVNHFLIKGVLFLAIAGVIFRTGTSEMYKMGGLIKKMPWSFTAVMFGIIAISGVPPLTGFGAKWLMYNALIEKGWYLQTGMAFFASTVAFLYCFRLIHAIFLGQPKTEFRNIKEAPAWFLVPQYIFIMVIFLFSIFPKLLIERISAVVEPLFGQSLVWDGNSVASSLGYWNATAIMTIVGVIFVVLAAGLFIKLPKIQKVKQFNIVFAAEKPETPELTHFAYEFFRPYRRAMGWMVRPYATRFWNGVTESALAVSDSLRKIYTGNGQTYIFHIILFAAVLFLITVGVN